MQCYNIDKNIEPFHLFLTVGSGVGKSHAIKFIYNIAHSVLEPRREDHLITNVLLTAHTGAAAKSIGGHTINAAFKRRANNSSFIGPFLIAV